MLDIEKANEYIGKSVGSEKFPDLYREALARVLAEYEEYLSLPKPVIKRTIYEHTSAKTFDKNTQGIIDSYAKDGWQVAGFDKYEGTVWFKREKR